MVKNNARPAAPATRSAKRRRLNTGVSLTPKSLTSTGKALQTITISSSPSGATSPVKVKTEYDDDDDDEYEDIEEDEDEDEYEDEEKKPKVVVKKEKKDEDEDEEDEDNSNEPSVPRSMCLRCSKHLRNDPTLRCTRPTATSKCRRCSSMNKKCDTVPEPFLPALEGVQKLGLSLHRKEIRKPEFTKAASKYVSNVEAFGRKSRTKTPARNSKAEAPEANSVIEKLEKIEWRLEQLVRIGAVMAGTKVPSKDDDAAAFHAGEVDDD
ncbi:hypothetical protein FQN54_006159 [Arachnomyces sp. PD_36]|nr:hypothetical protein FQN54_006159 [Arachnomyces sp. PD_36]